MPRYIARRTCSSLDEARPWFIVDRVTGMPVMQDHAIAWYDREGVRRRLAELADRAR